MILRVWVLLVALAMPLCAGQSLRLTGDLGQVDSSLDLISGTSDIRVEGRFRSIADPGSSKSFIVLSGVGFRVDLISTVGIYITFARDTGSIECIVPFNRTDFLLRAQRLYNGGSPIHQCETWNPDGTGYTSVVDNTVGVQSWSSTGAALFGPSDGYVDYLRVFTSTVAMGGKPPATADNAGAWAAWKFDGNANDSSGNGRNLTVSPYGFSSSPDPFIVAVAKTENTPFWAPFRPLRAGHPSKLDGAASYSMSDGSSAVDCFWQQLEGQSNAIFDNRDSCTPTLTGLVFGPYKFRLRVRDQEGREAISDQEIGAVAYDDNDVVIYPDPKLSTLLGPIKVLGASEWEWLDERHVTLAKANMAKYSINRTDGYGWLPEYEQNPLFGVPRSGTVYTSNPLGDGTKIYGVGTNLLILCGGRAGPTISSAVLPLINLKMPFGNWHSRRVDSCQSDTEITLRDGIDSGTYPGAILSPGVEWSTMGLSTIHFDVTGTVYTSAGAPTKLYGVGTNFLAICGGVAGPSVPNTNVRVLESALSTTWGVVSCQSDTELTMSGSWATTHIDSPGVSWVWDDPRRDPGVWSSAFNINSTANYYDVALANYRLYYQSGWKTARDSARWMAGAWWKDGLWNGAWRTAALGAPMLLHAVDTSAPQYSAQFWPFMRAKLGTGANSFCPHKAPDIQDVRESAYCLMYMAEQAALDPDSTARATQRQRLVDAIDVYENRQAADGHWSSQNAGMGADQTRVFTVENGNSTVSKYSGADIPSDYCGTGFVTDGSITMSTGSRNIVGTGTNFTGLAGKALFIRGTYNGQPYSQYNEITSVTDSTHALAAYPWPGSSIASYRIQDRNQGSFFDMGVQTFYYVNADGSRFDYDVHDDGGWYWCTVSDAATLTLDRPYTGTTGTGYRRRSAGNPLDGSETYMMGLMATALYETANVVEPQDASVAARYRAVGENTIDWILSTMTPYDGKSTPYHSGWALCRPTNSIPNICDRNEPAWLMRSTMVEDNAAFAWRYLHSLASGDKAETDTWFGAQFAQAGYASPSPGDGDVAGMLLDENYSFSDSLLAKSYGQTYGVGGSDMWPAARVGGPADEDLRNHIASFTLPAGASDVKFETITAQGTTVETICTTSPCSVSVDRRAGRVRTRWTFRDGSQNTVARSDWTEWL